MPQRELIGPNAPQHATLPLTGGEVFHAVDEGGESVVIAVEDLPSGTPSDATPAALGTAAPGVATAYSRADHVHQAPTPAGIGAATTGALDAVSTVANAAVPKPIPAITTGEFLLAGAGGTLVGSGLTPAQFAAQLALYARILTPQVVISASRALTNDDAGKILVCDTSAGAIALTAPENLSAEWNALVLREGANAATVTGSGTMVMVGPAAVAGTVTIGVDDGMVSLVRRSASRCLAYGVVS